jgi:hypothetical protein
MNATAGTARAFARSVRDVIDWRGQTRHVLDGGSDFALPPVALFWGARDTVLPIAHAIATSSFLGGAPLTRFVSALECFLNAPIPVTAGAARARSAA